jgi:hypothetical protein
MANPATFPRPSGTRVILFVAHNAAVARLLFAEVVGRTPFPGLAKARMELRARAWAPDFVQRHPAELGSSSG